MDFLKLQIAEINLMNRYAVEPGLICRLSWCKTIFPRPTQCPNLRSATQETKKLEYRRVLALSLILSNPTQRQSLFWCFYAQIGRWTSYFKKNSFWTNKKIAICFTFTRKIEHEIALTGYPPPLGDSNLFLWITMNDNPTFLFCVFLLHRSGVILLLWLLYATDSLRTHILQHKGLGLLNWFR